jgi:hypothetical protein
MPRDRQGFGRARRLPGREFCVFYPDENNHRCTRLLLAFLGDRHADLANTIQPLYSERSETGESLVCGLCSREEFLREYEKESGLPVDPERLRYYEILMAWRTTVISIGGGARCAVGQTSHQDIMLTWLVPGVGPICIQSLHELVRDRI